MVIERIARAADRPVDAASAGAFRIGFGLVMFVAMARTLSRGWVNTHFLQPTHFFHFYGFAWVRPWPGSLMYVHFVVLAVCALAIALGIFYRAASVIFLLGFTYAHACDKTQYLNHYYLVTLLALLCCVLPLDRALCLRARWRPEAARRELVAWQVWLLRFQVGVVYVFGGIAKLGGDWLLHGEPLRIWLHADAALLGKYSHATWLALAFSWAGLLHDLCIVPLLLWRPTRTWAYVALVAFHLATSVLFPIGMFPYIMIVAATIFFAPSWPRRWLRAPAARCIAGATLNRPRVLALALYVLFQVLWPLRAALYPGNALWTEEGFRFAWKVMLIEKSGALTLRVIDREGHQSLVGPRAYLTPFQTVMASTQPDMILELAHMVANDFERRGLGPARVYADAEVSWNGRHHAPLIDPAVDLARESDGFAPKHWILPAPTAAPIF